MGFRNPILGGISLIREAIQSPDYSPGSAGWKIGRDGSSEFNDVEVRGVFSGTDYVANDAGIFLYSPAPGLGTLVASLAPVAGTDEYGNPYAAGLVAYDPNSATFGQLTAGYLQLGNLVNGVPDVANAAEIITGGASLSLLSLPDAANGFPAALVASLSSGQTTVPGPGGGEPVLRLTANATDAPASLQLSGAVIATQNNGTPEVWHAPTYNTGWSGATAMGSLTMMPTLRYRRDGQDRVLLEGLCTAASGAGSAVFQLPAGYRPAVNSSPIPVTIRSSGGVTTQAAMVVSTAGNLDVNANLGSAATAGSVYGISGSFPLGNVP